MTYLVIRQGVYIQGVWGPFDVAEEAILFARSLAAEDKDSYHSYDVRPVSRADLGRGDRDMGLGDGGLGEKIASFAQEHVVLKWTPHRPGTVMVPKAP